jgi:hypothetical protein
VAEAREAERVALEALRKAQEARAAVQSRATGAGSTYSHRRGALEQELRVSAEPQIAAFLVEMRTLFEATRSERVYAFEQLAGSNVVVDMLTGRTSPAVDVFSSRPAIEARLKAIRAAQEAASALQLEALTPAEVAERLADLKASIPAVAPVRVLENVRA